MKHSDWISVEERLPRTLNYVLVCRECDSERWCDIAAYVRYKGYAQWYNDQGFDLDDITHWQPIVLPKNK